jgi:hypothetical protein
MNLHFSPYKLLKKGRTITGGVLSQDLRYIDVNLKNSMRLQKFSFGKLLFTTNIFTHTRRPTKLLLARCENLAHNSQSTFQQYEFSVLWGCPETDVGKWGGGPEKTDDSGKNWVG